MQRNLKIGGKKIGLTPDQTKRWLAHKKRFKELHKIVFERRLTANEKHEWARLKRYFDGWFRRMTG